MNAPSSDSPTTSAPGGFHALVGGSASRISDTGNVDLEQSLQGLPPYARSLLRIKVPAIVTLASTRQPLQRLLQLGPGSIIQFNKPSDAPLTLEISNITVAMGEAVKVGDKYGVWITSMVLPSERFVTLTPSQHPTGS